MNYCVYLQDVCCHLQVALGLDCEKITEEPKFEEVRESADRQLIAECSFEGLYYVWFKGIDIEKAIKILWITSLGVVINLITRDFQALHKETIYAMKEHCTWFSLDEQVTNCDVSAKLQAGNF